ncbi:MAG: flavin reductase family protein [Clostridia bacterium]|nr:flavin reductase family protein [Clostridia bacterium]
MAKIAWKGGALLAPVPPVMVTCGSGDSANIITVAWAGLINTQPPRVSISVRPTRHSYRLIRESGEFIINLTPASLIRAADYCGMYTGAKVDKFKETGLTRADAQQVSCPLIAECPLALECRVISVQPQGTHDLFLADVVAVDVDDCIVDENGRLRLDKAGLAAFAHGEYFELGRKVGVFGFSAAKKHGGRKPGHNAKGK